MNKTYAGIGARKTPGAICSLMTEAASNLCQQGWVLHSGGALGADQAFSLGASRHKTSDQPVMRIFTPWEGFQGFSRKDYPNVHLFADMAPSLQSEAFNIAQQFHPAWDRLSNTVQLLMVRNSFQVLGPDLETPVRMVICWTPNGQGGGGTGQAIRIANHYNVPVIDLGRLSPTEAEAEVTKLL